MGIKPWFQSPALRTPEEVVRTCDLSTQEVGAEGSEAQGCPLAEDIEPEASLGYMEPWLCEENLRSSCLSNIDETSLQVGKIFGALPVCIQAATAECAQEMQSGEVSLVSPFYYSCVFTQIHQSVSSKRK